MKGLEMNRKEQHLDSNGQVQAITRKMIRWALGGMAAVGLIILIISWFLLVVPWVMNSPLAYKTQPTSKHAQEEAPPSVQKISDDIDRLNSKLERLTPGGSYLVINTTENTFSLYQRKQLIREGLCSTGSYVRLEVDHQTSWTFKTPQGVFSVKGKLVNPVWRKPDWAFLEDGLPVPPVDHQSRFEYGVLGDYALNLGNGYLIHGTLYKRFLGLPVTHGCVRMNDEDLEMVYQTLPQGAKVFIY